MKSFQVVFLVAGIAGMVFFYEVYHIGRLEEEAAVLRAQIERYNAWSTQSASLVRAFFDGLTLGTFANDGMFTESKKLDRESRQLNAARASLNSRYETAKSFRNTGLIVGAIAGVVGLILKRKTRNTA